VPPILVEICPACGSASAALAVAMDGAARERFLAFSRVKYRGVMDAWLDELAIEVMRCGPCGHHWYRQQPDQAQLLSMYDAAVPMTGGEVAGDASEHREATIRNQMMRLRRACHPTEDRLPTLLDFGSGFGRWPRAAVIAGFEVCAFEPSRSRGGARGPEFELVHDLESLEGRTFDVINVEQVLEHVPDPVTTLRRLRSFCEPHTIVRITVPNILQAVEGPDLWGDWPFDGRRPHTLAPFEHLHGFTPGSLERLISRAGLRSARAVRLWRHYPLGQFRSVLGTLLPRLGTTFRIVRLPDGSRP
jgi:hypothetical protein